MTYTRDEISAMSDDELRLAIADTKGIAMVCIPHTEYVTREMAIDAGDKSLEGQPIDFGNEWIPNPYLSDWPRDIAAAWELMDEMVANGKRPGIKRVAEHEWRAVADHDECDTYSTSAPRAIAEAYLLWKRTQGE